MCDSCSPISDDEFLLRRILPGQWVQATDRPTSANFGKRSTEVGLSLFRQSMCTDGEVMDEAPSPGFGLVRLQRSKIPAGIHIVITHPDELANTNLRQAHVELRHPTEEGGKDYTDSMKKQMARSAEILVRPRMP